MKVFHAIDAESSIISEQDKEKIAVLKLVDVGKYVENVGIRDGQFYIIAENNADEIYLEYKSALNNIHALMNTKMDWIQKMNTPDTMQKSLLKSWTSTDVENQLK
jgi:hypothetical protein